MARAEGFYYPLAELPQPWSNVVLVLKYGMYVITILTSSDYCTVLMLNVHMYGYYTLRIYVAVTFPYPLGRGITAAVTSLRV